ncbi:MAG: GTPase ObgE [Phycisphaerales bacterium]|jgi:GTP-binding protein
MFVDQAVIRVQAGHGGAGAVAFRRQKYEPKGGPQGGDGGKGGDVILQADDGINTLLDFRGRPDWQAEDGEDGMKKQCHGSNGRDCVIRLPAGTLVYDANSGELKVDLQPRQTFVIARGGKGGFGNEHYKSATNQTPTYAHPGFEGEAFDLRLELKLLADVGLLGKPNAGKSTLLGALTRANPKIANYPFTTLAPQLGVAELDPERRLVIADIPGLIEGASDGAGLGLDFLRHVERTRLLLHVLDIMPDEGTPAENYRIIRKELFNYSPVLAEREEIIVLNKLDLLESDEAREAAIRRLRADLKIGRDTEVVGISAATRKGTRELLERLWTILKGREVRWTADAPVQSANADHDQHDAETDAHIDADGIIQGRRAPEVKRVARKKPVAKTAAKKKAGIKQALPAKKSASARSTKPTTAVAKKSAKKSTKAVAKPVTKKLAKKAATMPASRRSRR